MVCPLFVVGTFSRLCWFVRFLGTPNPEAWAGFISNRTIRFPGRLPGRCRLLLSANGTAGSFFFTCHPDWRETSRTPIDLFPVQDFQYFARPRQKCLPGCRFSTG